MARPISARHTSWAKVRGELFGLRPLLKLAGKRVPGSHLDQIELVAPYSAMRKPAKFPWRASVVGAGGSLGC